MSKLSDKFKCVVIGEESLLLRCSEILLNRGHTILALISNNKINIDWANERKISSFNFEAGLDFFKKSPSFDYLFSITNFSILPEAVFNSASKMTINFHDGPLPKYAGLNAPSWALMDQVKEYGITWHQINGEIDKGDILKQVMFSVAEDENALSLNTKCYQAGAASFAELVDELATDSLIRTKQNLSERTYFGKFKKPENLGVINWNDDATKISAFVRALDFGRYPNILGLPKFKIENEYFAINDIQVTKRKSGYSPGTISEISETSISISTNTEDVEINRVSTLGGGKISSRELADKFSLNVGSSLGFINNEQSIILSDINKEIAKVEEYWVTELGNYEEIELRNLSNNIKPDEKIQIFKLNFDREIIKNLEIFGSNLQFVLASLFGIFLGMHSTKTKFTLCFSSDKLLNEITELKSILSDILPININYLEKNSIKSEVIQLYEKFETAFKAKTFINDIFSRYPGLKNLKDRFNSNYPVSIFFGEKQFNKSTLTLINTRDLKNAELAFDLTIFSEENADLLKNQFVNFVERAIASPNDTVSVLSIASIEEKKRILEEWNNTKTDFPNEKMINQLFEEQAYRTPLQTAVFCNGKSFTYEELNSRSNQLANELINRGVTRNTLVGICVKRSLDMLVSILGILKAGGAYVPLDPDFPDERIKYMIDDSGCHLIITENLLKSKIEPINNDLILIDSDWKQISDHQTNNLQVNSSSDSLAYVIYTSGSTGKPKGVMVTHRNVVNFITAMDHYIKFDESSVWLAVTSLSFDISVLEILWTLTRGLKVVLYTGDDRKVSRLSAYQNSIAFSLFYFSSYEGEKTKDKYKLLLEGAKFADQNNFEAVWTPERHFYDFGGLYPNPSITSAAISTVTKNIKLRAGSVVSPLHSTIRIAEEWSMVDNLSQGRVGISFAAGWQPDDFVIMPKNFNSRKELMFKQIEEVKALWRGETVAFTNPNGKEINVNILPRPVQPELPVWVTAAGNPETFEMAGRLGHNLLTHLLGQSISELSEKINIYRKAWRDAGHKGKGLLTLMLHTFVGPDANMVKETVRNPMKNYLRSAVNLVKEAAWSFPTYKNATTASDGSFNMDNLTSEDLDAILDYSFDRYYQNSGLFGTPETCRDIISKLKDIDVDEVACLIDFGVNSDLVLAHLYYLNQLRRESNIQTTSTIELNDYSIPSLISEHNVTHMQCTPSMAQMFLLDQSSSEALSNLKVLLIGGEAFSPKLAKNLRNVTNAEIYNMYGPTETTVWSTVSKLEKDNNNSIPIGKPISNTSVYILDESLNLTPIGVPGELYIGGEGVTKGYLNKEDLTSDKFITDPFTYLEGKKLYRTGDLAFFRNDGTIEFLGRLDHQIKIRGHRIELGEIENLISNYPDVSESVVMLREDVVGDQRLVAYLITKAEFSENVDSLKTMLKEKLPDYMIPSDFIIMNEFPLTPNKKIDRKSFPAPTEVNKFNKKTNFELPKNEIEIKIAEIWKELLKISDIGRNENFFDIGGHSLLAVQLHSKLKKNFVPGLTLIDIFKYPTISLLVNYIESKTSETDVPAIQVESKRIEISKKRKRRTRADGKNDIN